MSRRIYQRQCRRGRHRSADWVQFLLRELPRKGPGMAVAPGRPGGRFGTIRRHLRGMRPGEILYTVSCQYRVVLR